MARVHLSFRPLRWLVPLLVFSSLATAHATSPEWVVTTGTFHSASVGQTLHYRVFLPEGYPTSTRRFPVIYLLHGLPNDGSGYRTSLLTTVGAAAQKAGHPAIVVAPQGATAGDTDPEWHDWGGRRNWETMVTHDLVMQVDSTLRTIRGRAGRAIVGFSAGGYGALLIGLHHLERFSVIESWSGYEHPTNPVGDGPLDVGTDADNAHASAHTLVAALPRRLARLPTYIGFYVGSHDAHFVPENVQFDRELREAHVAHRFAVYPGGHTGVLWASHARDWVGAAARRLAS